MLYYAKTVILFMIKAWLLWRIYLKVLRGNKIMYASTSIRETSEMKIETSNSGGKETYCK